MKKTVLYANDSVSDFLARLKNAYMANHKNLSVSYIKILEEISKVLKKEGFVKDVKVITEKGEKGLIVSLSYRNRKPALANVLRVSKPGLRVYVSREHIPFVYGGFGAVIVSTPKGIMTGKDAKKQNVGGEVICKVW